MQTAGIFQAIWVINCCYMLNIYIKNTSKNWTQGQLMSDSTIITTKPQRHYQASQIMWIDYTGKQHFGIWVSNIVLTHVDHSEHINNQDNETPVGLIFLFTLIPALSFFRSFGSLAIHLHLPARHFHPPATHFNHPQLSHVSTTPSSQNACFGFCLH